MLSPFVVSLCLLAVMAGIILLFHMRPSPPQHLYAVFDTNEDPETFEQEVRRGIACAAEMNAVPVILLSADHPTELDQMLRLLAKEFPLPVLNAERFTVPYHF